MNNLTIKKGISYQFPSTEPLEGEVFYAVDTNRAYIYANSIWYPLPIEKEEDPKVQKAIPKICECCGAPMGSGNVCEYCGVRYE